MFSLFLVRTSVRLLALLLEFTLLASPAFSAEAPALTNLWRVRIGAKSDSSPALGPDGTLYIGNAKGEIWAISATGSPQWTFYTEREVWSSPAVGADGTVYVGSRDRCLYAITKTGRLHWKFQTGAWVDSSPALAHDGTIYFGSWDKNFYALRSDGKEAWRFPTEGEIVSSPAIGIDGTIYFGSHDGKFYALGPDGRKKWAYPTRGPILSSPAIGRDHTLYFTSVDGSLYALNPDGTLRWRFRTGGITESSPVIGEDDTLYVGVNQELWWIDANGKLIWPRGDGEPLLATPGALINNSVLYLSRRGAQMFLDRDRNVLAFYYCRGGGRSCAAIGPTGKFYTMDEAYFLSAIDSSIPMALTSWPRFRGNSRNTGNAADSPAPPKLPLAK